MIASDRQFHQARASLQCLRDALATEQLESSTDQDVAPELRDAAIASIQAQIDDLAAEITQFEDLKAGRVQTLALTGLVDLPDILIGARIAAGLTQSELAERIGASAEVTLQDRLSLPVVENKMKYKDLYTLNLPFSPPTEVRGNLSLDQQTEMTRALNSPRPTHKLRLTNSGTVPLTTAPAWPIESA